jgi:hypothetical protein
MSLLPSLLQAALGIPSTLALVTLSLKSVTVLSSSSLRVTFTAVPLASSSIGTNDALNPTNYYVTNNIVNKCKVVDGDTRSVDLFLTTKLPTSTGAVTVQNIQTPLGVGLSGTTSLSFTYTAAADFPLISGGATNKNVEGFIRGQLGPAFQGKAWDALIAAIAAGDVANWNNARSAFDQKFRSSAGGKYLDRRMADYGIARPNTLGLPDDTFRRLGTKVSSNKVTPQSILDMLEVFYGADAIHGVALSTLAEPYSIQAGDDLQILLDEKVAVPILFAANDFTTVGAATANEVAVALSRYLRLAGSKAYAIAFKNPATSTNFVKIYSSTSGLGSSVRVTGGKTQNVLRFPALLSARKNAAFQWLPSWTVTNPTPGTNRFTTTGPINLLADSVYVGSANWSAGVLSNPWASQPPVITLLPNTIVAPDGTLTATDVIANGATFNYTGQGIIANGVTNYTWSCWVKVPSGTQQFQFIIWNFTDNGTLQTETGIRTATTTWQRFTCTTTVPPGTGKIISGLIYPTVPTVNPSNGRIHVWGGQMEQGNTASDFVATTNNKAITNLLYFSEDLSNAVWGTNAHITVTPNSAIAPPTNGAGFTGTGASRLDMDGTGAGNALVQSFYANGGPYTASAWVRSVSGTVVCALNIRDVTSGRFVPSDNSFTATTAWQRFSVTALGIPAGNLCQVQFYINQNSVSVAVWGVQLENNSTLTGPYVVTTVGPVSIGGTGAYLDITQVKQGDYANIYSAFNTNNRGSLAITTISRSIVNGALVQSFDVTASTFISETVQQASATDLLFFRPTKNTLVQSGSAIVTQLPTGLNVTIPATTVAVTRSKNSAAYLQGQTPITPASLSRNSAGAITINTSTAHGLAVGQQVLIENVLAPGTLSPTLNVGSVNTASASVGSQWANLSTISPLGGRWQPTTLTLADGSALIVGGLDAGVNFFGDCTRFVATPIPTTQTIALGHILDSSTVVLYRCDESTAGTTLTDAGSNSFNVSAFGSPGVSIGQIGNGRVVSNGNTFSQTLSASVKTAFETMVLAGNWTVEFWFWADPGWGGTGGLFSYEGTGTPYGILIKLDSGASLVNVYQGAANVVVNMGAWGTPARSTWHHFAVRSTATSTTKETIDIFYDGQLQVTVPNITINTSLPTTPFLSIGAESSGFNSFAGQMDDIRVSNISRTNAEIQTSFIRGFAAPADGSQQYAYSWTLPPALPGALGIAQAAAALVPQTSLFNANKAFICGGRNTSTTTTNITNLYDPVANSWSAGPFMATSRGWPTATTLLNNKILITGGDVNDAACTVSADLFDPRLGTITATTGSMAAARAEHQAVLLNNGKVLIIGGRSGPTATAFSVLSSCELYDPVSKTFSTTGQMSFTRYAHRAVLLGDGRVLVAGGYGYSASQGGPANASALTSSEIYNPVTGAWQFAGNMSAPRRTHGLVYIPSTNRALAVGGYYGEEVAACDYYDVASGQWFVAPFTINTARAYAATVVLGNGTVLMAHGANNASANTRNAELFIPASDVYASGDVNGVYAITSVPSTTSFTLATNFKGYALNAASGATYTALSAAPSTTLSGPYIFDTKGGFAITSSSTTTLTGGQFANQKYSTLGLAANAGFTDVPAFIVLGYGTAQQQGPIKVLGRQNATTLLIDPAYTYTQNVPDGTSIIKLTNVGAFVPTSPQSVGSFYLTASGAGRQAASGLLDSMLGAGLKIAKTIAFPGDRGLGNESKPISLATKLSDVVGVFGSDNLDSELKALRGG